MVDLSIISLQRFPKGKSPWKIPWKTSIFLWFSHGFPSTWVFFSPEKSLKNVGALEPSQWNHTDSGLMPRRGCDLWWCGTPESPGTGGRRNGVFFHSKSWIFPETFPHSGWILPWSRFQDPADLGDAALPWSWRLVPYLSIVNSELLYQRVAKKL